MKTIAIALLFLSSIVTSISVGHLRSDLVTVRKQLKDYRTDMDALWLNQKEMVGTINQSVIDIERLKNQPTIQEYVDPEFDTSGNTVPVSPFDNRF